jgi:hypothetical protein
MTEQPKGSGPDPIGDLQRWLLRSGARGVSREVSDQVRSLFGGGGGGKRSANVWETATAPLAEEPPECAWCPICRAARMMKGSGPGLASHMATAGDTLATVVLEAVSTVESALSAAQRAAAENAAAAGQPRPGKDHEETADSWQTDSWQAAADHVAAPTAGTRAAAHESADQPDSAQKQGPPGKQDSAGKQAQAGEQDPAGEPAPQQTSGGSPHEPDHRG